MPKLYACISSPSASRDMPLLLAAAREFAYAIETADDGVLFDVSGLDRLIGGPEKIREKIVEFMRANEISGGVGVAETPDAARMLARSADAVEGPADGVFRKLPLAELDIERDTLRVFHDLGLRRIEDLLAIPRAELVGRYGIEFERVIRSAERRDPVPITPNVRETSAVWSYELDMPVEDFEQLVFLLNHGLEKIFARADRIGMSTDRVELAFDLDKKPVREYDIRAAFPTLERPFWLKLITLRISADPPGSAIRSLRAEAHFTPPRPDQKGLYAVSRPTPESLQLTLAKLKKLVGGENVGTPRLIDQRMERPFELDAAGIPLGVESPSPPERAVIAFTYYEPPLSADVLVREGRLVYLTTRHFRGRVAEYSGVWRGNSRWWDRPWRTQEWDVEIENGGLYRLAKAGKEWFIVGEYD
jgi:protein ImuB